MSATRSPTGPAPESQTATPGKDRQAQQQEAGAVAAVLGVEVAGGGGLPPDAANHPPHAVRDAHPDGTHAAADQDGGAGTEVRRESGASSDRSRRVRRTPRAADSPGWCGQP